jgi:16S rRNA (guanine966-N2)-methyltransferase
MRVISGSARGKKLVSLEGMNTRPTLDRVKEALFNIIQFDIADKTVLDLFAGSGAIGIEAISRGAKSVTFCDNSIDAIKAIKTNIENTKTSNKATVLNKDYMQALKYLAKNNIQFDIIYLDPPYKTEFANIAIKEIINLNLLSKDGIIIVETDDAKKEETIKKEKIEIFDKRKYGRAILIFIRKE